LVSRSFPVRARSVQPTTDQNSGEPHCNNALALRLRSAILHLHQLVTGTC